MARPSLQNFLSLTDPQMTYNWSVSIPRIPGVSDSRQITLRATSTSLPGTSIEAAQYEAHGLRLQKSGRRRYEDTWELTLIETRDSMTRSMILAWFELTQSWENNVGAYKADCAVPVELSLYDDMAKIVRSIQLVNAWPSNLGQVALSQSNEVMQYQMTLSFDYFKDVPTDASASSASTTGQ